MSTSTNSVSPWLGLTLAKLTVEEVPIDCWPAQHTKWDQYYQAARELFHVAEPTNGQITEILGMERTCSQILRSRRDDTMVDRLLVLVNANSREQAIRIAENFLNFLVAERPTAVS
jgi:hypothetical protein